MRNVVQLASANGFKARNNQFSGGDGFLPPGGNGGDMEQRVIGLEKDAEYARRDLDRQYELLQRMDGKLDGLGDKIDGKFSTLTEKIGGVQTKLLLAGFAAIAVICGFALGGFVWLHNLMMTILQITRV